MFQDFGMEYDMPNATSSMKRPEATPNKLLDPQENSRMQKTLSNLTQKFHDSNFFGKKKTFESLNEKTDSKQAICSMFMDLCLL